MKNEQIITLDYWQGQVPVTIIYKGINGEKRSYKLKPSADKCGILMNKDD